MRLPLLALLAKEPAHGYELKVRLEQTFGDAFPAPNIGQIYLTLQRLERAGLVRSQDVVQAARPNKRVYELTPAGREAVTAWVEEPSDGPRVRDDFFMKLILGPLAGVTDRLTLINRQRRHYLSLMRNLSGLAGRATEGNKISGLLVEGAMLHLQADLDWLEHCQEELLLPRADVPATSASAAAAAVRRTPAAQPSHRMRPTAAAGDGGGRSKPGT
jgi:DNA-binding PadR family transcriptional regulator